MELSKNILLVGFMGSGKSTIGRRLASLSGFKHVDIDDEILSFSGHSSISEIFELEGSSGFRSYEAAVMRKVLSESGQIISTGGGSLVYNPPHELKETGYLKKEDKIVFLHASFETSRKRCEITNKRPLFQDVEKAFNLYKERLPIYQSIADYSICIDHLNKQEAAKKILKFFK